MKHNKGVSKDSHIPLTPNNYIIQEVTESPFRTSYDLHSNNLGNDLLKSEVEALRKLKLILDTSNIDEIVNQVESLKKKAEAAKLSIDLAEKLKKLYCKLLSKPANDVNLPEVWRWMKGIINNFRELAIHNKQSIKQL